MIVGIEQIRLVAFDVDGVLTDGTIACGEGVESKRFSVRDGLAFHLLKAAGFKTMILSGRKSSSSRMKELQVDFLLEGVQDKLSALRDLCDREGFEFREICYCGDDLPDVAVIRQVGIGVAPADGVEQARQAAAVVTVASGGYGVAREIAEFLLKGQGKWEKTVAQYSI
jgi:3-deoxy-D-manno-octulosonate 8-phosphate phosphatase (KDO 8-P phosphatase)